MKEMLDITDGDPSKIIEHIRKMASEEKAPMPKNTMRELIGDKEVLKALKSWKRKNKKDGSSPHSSSRDN
jgi:hypothetical protein